MKDFGNGFFKASIFTMQSEERISSERMTLKTFGTITREEKI